MAEIKLILVKDNKAMNKKEGSEIIVRAQVQADYFIKAGIAVLPENYKANTELEPTNSPVTDPNPETPTSDQVESTASDSIDDIQAEINAANAPATDDSTPVTDAVSEETTIADQGETETVEEKAKASKIAKK